MEVAFWEAFREIAERRGMALAALAAEIDRDRGLEMGLATAIRLFVLRDLQARAQAVEVRQAGE